MVLQKTKKMDNYQASTNAILYRPIKNGNAFSSYMPFSNCSSVFLGQGDTKFAIDQMVETALMYQHQTQKLSEKFFHIPNKKDCTLKIWDFLFHHIQYKIDDFNQKLRSPACSWASRFEGIDCKSYSIFASCILLNLGIKHYFRRIKQAINPEGYTHVYVVVPKNQQTANLKQGYFVIDATIPPNSKELPNIGKDDVFVGSSANPVRLGSASVSAFNFTEITDRKTRKTKKKAWNDFLMKLSDLEKINPNNADLLRLKHKIYQIITNDEYPDIHIVGYSLVIDNEIYRLLVPAQGLGVSNHDAILKEHFAQAAYNQELTGEMMKQEVIGKIQAVGAIHQAVAQITAVFFPPAQIAVGVIQAVYTIVTVMYSLFAKNPCRKIDYQADDIKENLKHIFYPEFEKEMSKIKRALDNNTPLQAIEPLNQVLLEIDLGYANFYEEITKNENSKSYKCALAVLKQYKPYIDQIKKSVDMFLLGLEQALSKQYSFKIETIQASTSIRSWYFIVYKKHGIYNKTYRKVSLIDNAPIGVFPINENITFEKWLDEKRIHLKVLYGEEKANNYVAEMNNLKEKLLEGRRLWQRGLVYQFLEEDKLRKQQYEIYLKYDTNYHDKILRKAQELKQKFIAMNQAYLQELGLIKQSLLSDEKLKINRIKKIADFDAEQKTELEQQKTKNILLIGFFGVAVLFLLNKE